MMVWYFIINILEFAVTVRDILFRIRFARTGRIVCNKNAFQALSTLIHVFAALLLS